MEETGKEQLSFYKIGRCPRDFSCVGIKGEWAFDLMVEA